MTTQTVTIRYKVDSSGAIQATGAVVKTVTNLGAAATKTNSAFAAQQRQINGIQGALREYTQNLRSLFGLYLTFQGIQTFSRFVDEYTNLNGRLKVVIDNTQKYAIAQSQVYQIAQTTYTSLSATANLYARLTVALEELNSSQNEIALVTQTVNQALLVSGATSAEASSAVIQLSQSFASGVLRGEEFNAVNEAAPRIMTALAKSLGVSRGALREMASEGKLTAEVLRKALVDDALNIAKEAENVPLTIGRGYERLRNDLLQYVGAADSVYGVSRQVAEGLVYIGQNLDSLISTMGQALITIAAFLGAKGLAGFLISAGSVGGAVTAMRAGILALGVAFGGVPALVGAAVAALVIFREEIFSVGQVSDQAADNLERLKLMFKIDPDASAKLAVETYEMLKNRIAEVRTELENLSGSGLGFLEKGIKGNQLTAELATLEVQLQKADAEFDKFNNHAQRSAGGMDKSGSAARKLANDQKALADALRAGGDPLGRQLEAYESLAAKLKNYDEQIRRAPQNEKILTQAKQEAIAALQKELALINKSAQPKKASAASDLSRASATERLNNIIAQFSREQDDANKILKQLSGVQLEVNNLLGKHPKLSQLAEQATRLIADAAAEARDKFREFKNAVKELLDQFGQGNINQTSQQLLQLGIALDEAFASGNTEEAEKILRAMQAIEEQSGLSVTASEELRDANQRLSDEAKEQAEAYRGYWEGAFGEISDSIGEFIAGGMKDWKDFGKSLLKTVQKIIADIISEFLRLKIINPVLNQIFAGSAGSGAFAGAVASGSAGFSLGGSLLGSLLGVGGSLLGGAAATGAAAGSGAFAGAVASGSAGFSLGGAGAMSLLGPIAAIGVAVYALTRILKDDQETILRVRSQEFNGDRRARGTATSQLGEIFVRGESLGDGAAVKIAEGIAEFDNIIAGLLNEEQLAAVRLRLTAVNDTFRDGAATVGEALDARFGAILGELSTDVQEFVGVAGELEERVKRLADALAIEAAVEAGDLGDTFAGVSDLLLDYRIGTEALSETYTRVLGSVNLLDSVVSMTGTTFDLARDDFVRFAADIVDAAGGLERASQLWASYFQTFYSEEERQAFAVQNARSSAGSQLSDIGLDIANFEGGGALAQFRQLFEQALPNLSAEAVVEWLEAADALGAFVNATATVNTVIEESVESFSSLAELMLEVKGDINEFSDGAQTFAQRIEALNVDIENLVQRALALGASEEQIAAIRELGQLRLGRILAEQATALNEYNSFIAGFRTSASAGLSDFQQELQQIATDASAAAVEANRLAVAAGLAGAATEDLATIQAHAANLAAEAARRLEESILSLAEQLGYASDEANSRDWGDTALGFAHWLAEQQGTGGGGAAAVDPERYNLALTLGQQLRELAEFTGDSVVDLMERLQIPFDRLMADFGVSIGNIGDPEIFDRLATASRTMGIELTDAASQLGISLGELSNASSLLNDGFERAVSRLPAAVSGQLTNLLRNLETSIGPEAQAEARRQLADFINAQPPAIRDALAPYLDDVDTSSIESQQLAASDQTNRYLSAANGYLERIVTNTGRLPTAGGPNPRAGEKTIDAGDQETHRLLRAVIAALGAVEKEQRSANQKSTLGIK